MASNATDTTGAADARPPGGPGGPAVDVLLCLAPLVFLVITTLSKRLFLPSSTSLPLAAAALWLIKLAYLGAPAAAATAAVLQGLLLALTPLSILASAFFFFNVLVATQCMPYVAAVIRSASQDHPVAEVMLVPWALGHLIEGASGFGTGPALLPPLMMTLGHPPFEVVVALLIMTSTVGPFGSSGIPIWFGLASLDWDRRQLTKVSFVTSIVLAVVSFPLAIMSARLLLSWADLRGCWLFGILSIASCAIPVLATSMFSFEAPGIISGVVGLVVTGLMARRRFGLRQDVPCVAARRLRDAEAGFVGSYADGEATSAGGVTADGTAPAASAADADGNTAVASPLPHASNSSATDSSNLDRPRSLSCSSVEAQHVGSRAPGSLELATLSGAAAGAGGATGSRTTGTGARALTSAGAEEVFSPSALRRRRLRPGWALPGVEAHEAPPAGAGDAAAASADASGMGGDGRSAHDTALLYVDSPHSIEGGRRKARRSLHRSSVCLAELCIGEQTDQGGSEESSLLAWPLRTCHSEIMAASCASSEGLGPQQKYEWGGHVRTVLALPCPVEPVSAAVLASSPRSPDAARALLVDRRQLAARLAPWGAMLVLVGATRLPYLQHSNGQELTLHLRALGNLSFSSNLVISLRDIFREGLNWSFPLIYTPALLPFVLPAVATLFAFRRSLPPGRRSWRQPFREATAKTRAVAPSILGALVLVALLVQGGTEAPSYIMGYWLSRWLKRGYIAVALLFGTAGAFFSGSVATSNMTFASLQEVAADHLGLSPEGMTMLQIVGGAAGQMIAISSILGGRAAAGLQSVPEGRFVRLALPAVALYYVVGTLLALPFLFSS